MREQVEAEMQEKQNQLQAINQQMQRLDQERQQVVERMIELRGQMQLLDKLDKEADDVQNEGRDKE
jgi:prefoldin subunit 5